MLLIILYFSAYTKGSENSFVFECDADDDDDEAVVGGVCSIVPAWGSCLPLNCSDLSLLLFLYTLFCSLNPKLGESMEEKE